MADGVPPDTDEARVRAVTAAMSILRIESRGENHNPWPNSTVVMLAAGIDRMETELRAAEVRAEQLEAALQPLVEQFEADGLYDHSLDDVPEDDWQSGPNVTLRMVRAARAAVAGDPDA